MPRRPLLLLVAAAALSLAAPTGASALTVYAAASLRDALPQIDSRPSYDFAGSNALQSQIERGAPADVLASASPKEAQALFREGRCTRPVTFATNKLVLITPKDNPGAIRSVYTLRRGGKRLAIGTAGVPIGDYTRRLLQRLRLSSVLSANTVSQETSVTSITSKVALGSADAGFVYFTDAKAAYERVRTLRLPRYAQPPVRYEACVVRREGGDGAGGNAFLRRLIARAGRKILRRFGFGLPPRG